MGKEEVLATELELELAAESANDFDLSLFTFCRNFGSFDDECGVDGVGEEFDGVWRDLLEDIVPRSDYVLTRLGSPLSSVMAEGDRGVYSRPQASLRSSSPSSPSPLIN
jgi:hypothetical protein